MLTGYGLSIVFNHSNAEATFVQSTRMQRLENHLNHVMLVFIGKLLQNALTWVTMCQGFSHFSHFLCHVVMAKLAKSSIRVNPQGPHMLKVFVLKKRKACPSICNYNSPPTNPNNPVYETVSSPKFVDHLSRKPRVNPLFVLMSGWRNIFSLIY